MALENSAYKLDPVAWVHDLDFLPPSRDGQPGKLDRWQADVIRSTSKRLLLNCSRQSGKSTTVALYALWMATFRPSGLILCLSPTLRQSSELLYKIYQFYGTDASVPSKSESTLKLELENGSRIISLPGNEATVRGYSAVDLLIIDEGAQVVDNLYYSVLPMLCVSDGKLIALSTPWGTLGWFYHTWMEGENWQKIQITADDCPRISRAVLDEHRRTWPQGKFLSEYYCVFSEAEGERESQDAERHCLPSTLTLKGRRRLMAESVDLKRKGAHHIRKLKEARNSGDPRKMARALLGATEFWRELQSITGKLPQNKVVRPQEQPEPELRKSYALEAWMEGRNRVHKEPWMSTSSIRRT